MLRSFYQPQSKNLLCESRLATPKLRRLQRFCWSAKDKSFVVSLEKFPPAASLCHGLSFNSRSPAVSLSFLAQLNCAENENTPDSLFSILFTLPTQYLTSMLNLIMSKTKHSTFLLKPALQVFSISSQWQLYFPVGQAPNLEIIIDSSSYNPHWQQILLTSGTQAKSNGSTITITLYHPRLSHHLSSAHCCSATVSLSLLLSTC